MYLDDFGKQDIMENNTIIIEVKKVIENIPENWINLTTHRLDIYNEEKAKTQFLNQFEDLLKKEDYTTLELDKLPTAYDYIRLGHPLSCILEWAIAKLNSTYAENIISFSSFTTPLLAVLRHNLLANKKTRILYTGELPTFIDTSLLTTVYEFQFELEKIDSINNIKSFEGSTILLSGQNNINRFELNPKIDFIINNYANLGSILIINGSENNDYISSIQHSRRRETIAMTPTNSIIALKHLINNSGIDTSNKDTTKDKNSVLSSLKEITGTTITPLVASSGLSMQYAIMMGIIDDAKTNHKGKAIKIVIPPNCYGGTNDQARRIAAVNKNVEVLDLPVDGNNDMVNGIDTILDKIASQNAIPYIIAEIPTNPRVEVPDLLKLKEVLIKSRKTSSGENAVEPVFILDQTFCPNVLFLGEDKLLSSVKAISYASGSKFPSGGLCTAGYCVSNNKGADLMKKIETHLVLCDNEATAKQLEILAKQLPSMNNRIASAYQNTREFVTFIKEVLPEAKINFVSEQLAKETFTPSVFSLDLPTKGNTDDERENYKRALNLKLIHLMINEIPNESKFCVSYGQLKGCYWTIPATSTQGTTKEGDKDYIVRASLSGNMDLERHKEVFKAFVENI